MGRGRGRGRGGRGRGRSRGRGSGHHAPQNEESVQKPPFDLRLIANSDFLEKAKAAGALRTIGHPTSMLKTPNAINACCIMHVRAFARLWRKLSRWLVPPTAQQHSAVSASLCGHHISCIRSNR